MAEFHFITQQKDNKPAKAMLSGLGGREEGGRSLLKAAIPVFGCGIWSLLSAQSRLFAGGAFPPLPCVKSTGGPCDGGLSSDGKGARSDYTRGKANFRC